MDRDLKWFAMPVAEQLANVGGEVGRAIRWKARGDAQKSRNFCDKAIEFLELSVRDPKNKHRVGELINAEEELKDYFFGENMFGTTDEALMKYYDAFLQRI